jgi:hypothetical protein
MPLHGDRVGDAAAGRRSLKKTAHLQKHGFTRKGTFQGSSVILETIIT